MNKADFILSPERKNVSDMKINTRKLLLLTALLGEQGLPLEKVDMVWADLSAAGRRSLLSKLFKSQLLRKESRNNREHLISTKTALIQLKSSYPQLIHQPSQLLEPTETLLIFLQATARDPHFRMLQPLLKKSGWLPLQKSVYIYPSKPTMEVVSLLEKKYSTAVCLIELKSWQIGDIKSLYNKYYHLDDLESSLSGISREFADLIDSFILNKISIDQSKNDIYSVFNRLISIFDESTQVPPGIFSKILDELSLTKNLILLTQKLSSEA